MTAVHLRVTMACRQHHFIQAERRTERALGSTLVTVQTVTVLHCANCGAWKKLDFKPEAMLS